MRTKVFYHGTKASVNEVMNNPMMKPAANGYGLYLTDNIHVARSYGEVIAFEVPWDFEVDVIRPLQPATFKCMEYVINTQATWVKFMRALEDVYPEPYATPF